ncbi:hypothetical protein BLD44_028530 [Mastigocladus laminosus UU774]|nr:hypothetical protein BLD44_028530 [Mastigocladus laminosus UU774]
MTFNWEVRQHDEDGTTKLRCLNSEEYEAQVPEHLDLNLCNDSIWVATNDLNTYPKGAKLTGTVIEDSAHWIGTAFEQD